MGVVYGWMDGWMDGWMVCNKKKIDEGNSQDI